MVKEPRPGRVKTRLGREIGMGAAAWWYRHQCLRLIRRLRDPRWRIVLAVAPDQALNGPFLPCDLPQVPQGAGDLGQRMARALARARGPVCLVGSDIPGLDRRHIARAFEALRGRDAVFGPATDGGYWLVGLRRGGLARAGMFGPVRWSSPHALADSRAALAGWRIALADRLADVDTAADLRALAHRDFCR